MGAKDLSLHLDYIGDLTLICPRIFAEASQTHDVPLNGPPFDRIKFVDLPSPQSRFVALLSLPKLGTVTWKAIRKNAMKFTRDLVAGLIPEGWITAPLARLQRKFVLTNVEIFHGVLTQPKWDGQNEQERRLLSSQIIYA